MQIIIMAAGKGTRLRPLTSKIPKVMIRVGGKNLIEYKLDQLPKEVDEIILVVGYLADQVIGYFGNEYQGKKITYVRMKKLLGSGYCVHLCRKLVRGRFLVVNGDDLYGKNDFKKILKYDLALLAQKVKPDFRGGRITMDERGALQSIVENSLVSDKVNLVNTGLYMLNKNFFKYKLVAIKDGKEFGLPQTLVSMSRDYPVKIIKTKKWLPVNNLEELEIAEAKLKGD